MFWKWWLVFAQWLPVTPLWYGVDTVGASNSATGEEKKESVCYCLWGVRFSPTTASLFTLFVRCASPVVMQPHQNTEASNGQGTIDDTQWKTWDILLFSSAQWHLRFESCCSLPTVTDESSFTFLGLAYSYSWVRAAAPSTSWNALLGSCIPLQIESSQKSLEATWLSVEPELVRVSL